MKKIELVSPAGNFQSLRSAIKAGCDAVYFGGKNFNARLNADNFTNEELKEAIKLCRKNNVKAYITVNTLISDNETKEFIDFLKYLSSLSPDALIIQDIGILYLIKEEGINIPLHASTQMNVTNSQTAKFLKDIGIKRIILARELTFSEIISIKSKVDIEIEIFTHGALCFSYSGLCLFSSYVGGRSGNRGTCSQPCRLNYNIYENNKLINKSKTYPLSCKDLCLIDYISQIANSSIDALKIEGRGKNWEYVALTTSIYRKAIDSYYESPDKFEIPPEYKIKLEQIFNRGFTKGEIFSDKNILGFTRPNNRGVLLGRIESVDYKNSIVKIATKYPINKKDKIEIWTSKGGRVVVEAKEKSKEKAEIKIPSCMINQIKVKDRVFRTFDAQLQKEIEEYL